MGQSISETVYLHINGGKRTARNRYYSSCIIWRLRQAIEGNAPYRDPQNGRMMLSYDMPAGQPFNSGGETYVRDNQGTFHRQVGNGWVPVEADTTKTTNTQSKQVAGRLAGYL